jgi:magnesium chelatase family protein
LIGGGSCPRPGEVSLAHHGVLFLDELPEFRSHVIEALRQPLEDHAVTIARATMTLTYPAQFTLVAAMNPCPCGYLGDPRRPCTCSPPVIQRYRARLSGPLLDRIDLHVEVPPVSYEELAQRQPGESSARIRDRVNQARARQQARFKGQSDLFCNARMGARSIRHHCPVKGEGEALLERAIARLGFSARAYDRILKVARTIADLEGSEEILPPHVSEAVQYRSLDRGLWR